MSYPAAVVANAILYRARQRGTFVDHMKLQKLLFFTHAWLLAAHDRSAVNEEPEAWQYGPVFKSLYHDLKGIGRRAISEYVSSVDPVTRQTVRVMPNPGDTALWSVLDQVMDRYGAMTALQLSTLSHEVNGPWDLARRAGQAAVPNSTVRDHYRRLLNEHQRQQGQLQPQPQPSNAAAG